MSPLLRRLAFAALAALGAALLAFVGLNLWRLQVDQRLDAGWRKALGGRTFLERYPPTKDNASLRELENLLAELGLRLAPAEAQGRRRPSPELEARFKEVRTSLKEYLDAGFDGEDGSPVPKPPALAAYLKSTRPVLLRVIDLLLTRPPPVWETDLRRVSAKPLHNWLAVLDLVKLLAIEARDRAQAGDLPQALASLEASWRLNEAVQVSPLLVPQLIRVANLKPLLMALRDLPAAPPVWRQRLAALDLQGDIFRALQAEAFLQHQESRRDRPYSSEGPEGVPPFLLRWALWDTARRFDRSVEELRQEPLLRFDPEAFAERQETQIPRWQIVARLMLPNFWDAWPKAARRELTVDLTLRVLAERERLAGGGASHPASREPSRVKGLDWLYEPVPDGTRIRLSGEPAYVQPNSEPLCFLIRKPPASGR